jgi:hypothetical protein
MQIIRQPDEKDASAIAQIDNQIAVLRRWLTELEASKAAILNEAALKALALKASTAAVPAENRNAIILGASMESAILNKKPFVGNTSASAAPAQRSAAVLPAARPA